jgi:hypothetical protein
MALLNYLHLKHKIFKHIFPSKNCQFFASKLFKKRMLFGVKHE